MKLSAAEFLTTVREIKAGIQVCNNMISWKHRFTLLSTTECASVLNLPFTTHDRKGSQLLLLSASHPCLWEQTTPCMGMFLHIFKVFPSIPTSCHCGNLNTFCTGRDHMGWVCFALFFLPRPSPRDNSFVPAAVRTVRPNKKNYTKEELFTAI